MPQPAGPRRAIIRVPEPLGLHAFTGSEDEALDLLRARMQAALDAINAGLAADGGTAHLSEPVPSAAVRGCLTARTCAASTLGQGAGNVAALISTIADQRSHVGGSPMLPLC